MESRGKRPFKIWDGYRNTRKSLVASSLNELESRGKEKLNIGPAETVRLVLEADGTQIEDPDYFKTLPNNTTVLLLRDGESWSPAGVEAITAALTAIPKVVLQTIHSLKLQHETPSWKVAYNKGRVTVVLYWDQRSTHGPQESSARREQQPSTSGAATPPLVAPNIRLGDFPKSNESSVPATRGQAARTPVPHVVVMPSQTIPGFHWTLPRQGSSMEAAAIHVHTPECAYNAHRPAAGGSSRSSSPTLGMPSTPIFHPSFPGHKPGCDFHCCSVFVSRRRPRSVTISPIQISQELPPPPGFQEPPLDFQQRPLPPPPQQSALADGTRRPSPKAHVHFLDAADTILPPPLLLPPPLSAGRHHVETDDDISGYDVIEEGAVGYDTVEINAAGVVRSDSSETDTTVIEGNSMTYDMVLALIDESEPGHPDLTIEDIGFFLKNLDYTIIDVNQLQRVGIKDWVLKATIQSRKRINLCIIHGDGYYRLFEHPKYPLEGVATEAIDCTTEDLNDDEEVKI
ncbi:uncharacterized protein LOC126844132 isoform X2 [Adelges cooleyi]|uniref:uncharacterized protein LOC126844132 isoform X2 n=1 Tax=Adelges cooleyi TaxID=133065 RepID=UPI00217F8E81|nr:uncharacterized protein LOC126844132 isoform X2 [Adelges cooleyi]